MQKMKKILSEQEIYLKLSGLCSTCEYSPFDIRRKAVAYGASAEAADKVVDRLIDENYISEQRYADSFVHDKFEFNRWGRNKIVAALRLKHIPSACIDEAMDSIDAEEYRKVLQELLAAKNRQTKEPDVYKRVKKLLAFAASRGFELELAYDMVNDLCRQDTF